jgi:sulfur-oxidizing protein SoxY
MLNRRSALAALSATLLVRPARGEVADMERAIREFTGGVQPTPGTVLLDIAPLVENGNSVSVAVTMAEGAVLPAPVTAIALFNEKNPQPNVATFHFGPRAGGIWAATRMRMATTQHIAAVAKLANGACFIDMKEVIVTIAACTEE